jgi:hypothetical protein
MFQKIPGKQRFRKKTAEILEATKHIFFYMFG